MFTTAFLDLPPLEEAAGSSVKSPARHGSCEDANRPRANGHAGLRTLRPGHRPPQQLVECPDDPSWFHGEDLVVTSHDHPFVSGYRDHRYGAMSVPMNS